MKSARRLWSPLWLLVRRSRPTETDKNKVLQKETANVNFNISNQPQTERGQAPPPSPVSREREGGRARTTSLPAGQTDFSLVTVNPKQSWRDPSRWVGGPTLNQRSPLAEIPTHEMIKRVMKEARGRGKIGGRG